MWYLMFMEGITFKVRQVRVADNQRQSLGVIYALGNTKQPDASFRPVRMPNPSRQNNLHINLGLLRIIRHSLWKSPSQTKIEIDCSQTPI